MNIAIFTDTFYPQINGIVVSNLELIKGLVAKGHKVYVVTCNKPFGTKEFEYPNVVVKRMPSIPALFYPEYKLGAPFSKKLLSYFLAEKIDLIHFQTPVFIGLNAIIMAKILEVPLIGTFHTFITCKEYRKHLLVGHALLDNASWKYVRAYYNQCDLVTVPTESARKELLRNNIKEPISVISNGIKIPKDIKQNTSQPNLLFVGRIAYEKNIFYLLDCFKLIVESIQKAKLTVVGDGPQMSEFKKRIRSLGLEQNVILKGAIKHENLMGSSIFKENKIFVTASLTETQGITLLEAQSRGLVAVGVDANGTRDLIKDGCNGFLVKEGNKKEFALKVIKILSNKKWYQKMRNYNSKILKNHEMSRVIDQWIKTYSKCIKYQNGKKNLLHSSSV